MRCTSLQSAAPFTSRSPALSRRASVFALFVLVLSLGACGAGRLPSQTVPAFDPLPGSPAAGSGRIVLDVEGRRCRVRLSSVHTTGAGAHVSQPPRRGEAPVLCVTPCQVELTVGWHRLTFCDEADFLIPVGREESVVRAHLSRLSPPRVTHWLITASTRAP